MPHPRSCRRTLSNHPVTCTNGSLREESGRLSVSPSSTVYEARLEQPRIQVLHVHNTLGARDPGSDLLRCAAAWHGVGERFGLPRAEHSGFSS